MNITGSTQLKFINQIGKLDSGYSQIIKVSFEWHYFSLVPENRISLEDHICISFVSFVLIFLSHRRHLLLLKCPQRFFWYPWSFAEMVQWSLLVDAMLNKPAFLTPSPIGFVSQSISISFILHMYNINQSRQT